MASSSRSCTIIIMPSLSTSSFLRALTYTFASKGSSQLAISRIVGNCNISLKWLHIIRKQSNLKSTCAGYLYRQLKEVAHKAQYEKRPVCDRHSARFLVFKESVIQNKMQKIFNIQ